MPCNASQILDQDIFTSVALSCYFGKFQKGKESSKKLGPDLISKVDISDQVWSISSKTDVIRSSDVHSCSLACKDTLVFEIVFAFIHFSITSSSMQSINFQTFFLSSPLFSSAGALLVITVLALSSLVHSFQHFAQTLIRNFH